MPEGNPDWDIVVIGGGGHVGLPLSIALADRGARVLVYDISDDAVASINSGRLFFTLPTSAAASHASIAPMVMALVD